MMKKIVAALALGLASMPAFAQLSGQVNTIPGVPQAVGVTATASPQNRPDGTAGAQIADREGNLKAALGHAEYTESARRGKVFTISTAAYTVTATNLSAGAIGTAKPIVGFYNPTGSGVNAIILNQEEWHTSGTPGGPLILNYFCGQTWTSVSSGTIYNNLLSNNTPNGSAMIAQMHQNLATTPAITSAMLVLEPAGGPAAVAATGVPLGHSKDWKGQIVVQPGCAFGLFTTGTGTTDILNASLSWEEVAQ